MVGRVLGRCPEFSRQTVPLTEISPHSTISTITKGLLNLCPQWTAMSNSGFLVLKKQQNWV